MLLKVKPRVNAGGLVIMEVEQNYWGLTPPQTTPPQTPILLDHQSSFKRALHVGQPKMKAASCCSFPVLR